MRTPIWPLAPGLVALALTGCRSEPERSAMAQVPAEQGSTLTVDPRPASPEVTLRRLRAGSDVIPYAQSISPDGRYLSTVDGNSYDLAVRDLETDELHLLTSVGSVGNEGRPTEIADVTLFSRDGRRIASSWLYGSDGIRLRVSDFEPDAGGTPHATEPRIIFDNPELAPQYPFDWSPDGRHVVAHVYNTAGKTSQLGLISTTDGTYRALKSLDWREPNRAAFSPDGRYVAYSIPSEQGSGDYDVFVVSVDGTYESRVVDGPGFDGLLGWHPDGDILFHSDRGDTPAVWRIRMSDGRPVGAAELVKGGMRSVEALGFAGDGFYYGVQVDRPQPYLATVDLAAGRLASAPVPVEDPARIHTPSRIRGWDWSPDGGFLAYSREMGQGRSAIVIRPNHGEGEEVSLQLDLNAARQMRYAPDGRSLILFTDDARGRRGFYRVDLATGSYSTIVRNGQLDHPTRGRFDISPDGRTIWFFGFVAIDDASARWSLIAYDLDSGASRSMTPAEWRARGSRMGPVDASIAVSPDGTRLAIVAPDTTSTDPVRQIGTIPVEGGPFTPLAHLEPGRYAIGPLWTPDGRSLVFSTIEPEVDNRRWTTWVVPAEGGEVRPLELMEGLDARGMKLHPDGRRLAFMAGERRGELWVMEGLWEPASTTAETEDSR